MKVLEMNLNFKWVQNVGDEDFIYFGYIGPVKTNLQLEIYSETDALLFEVNHTQRSQVLEKPELAVQAGLAELKNSEYYAVIHDTTRVIGKGTAEQCKKIALKYLKADYEKIHNSIRAIN